MVEFSEAELLEMKYLWLNRCFTIKEIAEWYGVSRFVIKKRIREIKVDYREFQEKNMGFAEFLKQHPNSRIAERMIKERKKRLQKAYDRTRYSR